MFIDILKIDFVPEGCKGENPLFTGKLVMRVPHAHEKFTLIRDVGVRYGIDGTNKVDTDTLQQLSEFSKIANQFFVQSELTDNETKRPVSKEEIFYNVESKQKFMTLPIEMGKFMLELCLPKK